MKTETELQTQIKRLANLLQAQDHKMATAESCTGGLIAKAATDLAGSSNWFDRALVTYSNQAKIDLLSVSANTLAKYGAVSLEVINEMIKGLMSDASYSMGVAISGIAGPEGGSDEKPVGTVWIAWGVLDYDIRARCYQFSGDREQVRLQAAIAAIEGLIEYLEDD